MGLYVVNKTDIKRDMKCKLCGGRGFIPMRFYMRNTNVICHMCNGTGKDKFVNLQIERRKV